LILGTPGRSAPRWRRHKVASSTRCCVPSGPQDMVSRCS
jgi:hypothetical protein